MNVEYIDNIQIAQVIHYKCGIICEYVRDK